MARIEIIKKWNHSPKVNLNVHSSGHSVDMDHEDFISSLSEELKIELFNAVVEELRNNLFNALSSGMGSVTWIFRKKTFNDLLKMVLDSQVSAITRRVLDAKVPTAVNKSNDTVIFEMKKQAVKNFTRGKNVQTD